MSTLAQHRAAIVAALASVPDVGIVHDRERYADGNAKFAALYVYTPAAGKPHIRAGGCAAARPNTAPTWAAL